METRQASGQGHRPALRSLTAIAGAIAAVAAVLVGVVLAVVFAATVVVIGVMLSALLALAALAHRAGRLARRRTGPVGEDGVIEARHLGGHHWVAYGWNERP
ncbi:MAG: hypothetical protein A2882_02040 [Phenylobacterium sp. RIFCSPHIGHO2_01_FULL_70_10]|nr:MAG: hypothetical protein A2882_02040 [Phenylobacterium sp. RIFCSPHIGHO2_01_FULL_70_10]